MREIATERLLLRRAYPADCEAMFPMYSDADALRFVPILPANNIDDMKKIYRELWEASLSWENACRYLICLRDTGEIAGYIHISPGDAHDFGYGLRRAFWGKGIATEAARAVLDVAKEMGLPFVTATHDRENPKSGAVMRRIGMTYRYSYPEQWMPKNQAAIFRMYQMGFTTDETYRGYQMLRPGWFVEEE
ncbi:MAG: GNAT family N-acetyltransferase [Christensenellales bacterium]|jgi:ribosomal-protein-alanine N-acetyltransferase